MTKKMDSRVNIPSRSIPNNRIQPPIGLKDQIKYRQVQSSTILLKASVRDHITSSKEKKQSKGNLRAISHMYVPKTFISSRIHKFRRGPLRIFPFDGQIQGEVVVRTINGDNLGGSNYLCPFKLIGITST